MLRVDRLNSAYGPSHVLFDVTLTVASGEIVALLGRNGAGKTTTIASIVGFVACRSGRIELDGRRIDRLPAHRRVRAGLGYVPQSGRAFRGLTVRENLEIVRGRDGSARPSIESIFDLFPALRPIADRDAGVLSGGQRQMLAIARALMVRPRILLLDEPSEGLAPVIVRSLADLVRRLTADGVGILLAEQNHRFALDVADRAYLIEKGRICHEGRARDLPGSAALHRYLGV